jgi:hypothetical protein
VPPEVPHFSHTVELVQGEAILLRPDQKFPDFWNFVAEGREFEPLSVVQVCIFGVCSVEISGGIEGVEFKLAPPGTVSHGMTSTELPPGLQLHEKGVIHGIPQEPGEWRPLIRAVDLGNNSIIAELWLEMEVTPKPVVDTVRLVIEACEEDPFGPHIIGLHITLQVEGEQPVVVTTLAKVDVPKGKKVTLTAPAVENITGKSRKFEGWFACDANKNQCSPLSGKRIITVQAGQIPWLVAVYI